MMKMLGFVDHGLVDISAMALNAAISGSILADPDACFVIMMALPFASLLALATAFAWTWQRAYYGHFVRHLLARFTCLLV